SSMIETIHLPQLERLLLRIERSDTPLVQVWGWPGSGKSAVLSAFLAVHEGEAHGLALAELAGDPGAAWQGGTRWLVVAGDPGEERLREVVRRLRPGQQLIFAGERRSGCLAELPGAVIPPQELLASPDEVAALWHLVTGETPDENAVERLHAA